MAVSDVREQMIEQQVRAWDVLDDRVLAVLRRVPREAFVPPEQRFIAYADAEVPLPHAQHMLRPSVAGRLLQALEPVAHEHVLEIGTGSGFISACLRAAGARVRTLEIFAELAALAGRNLAATGMGDVEVVNADAFNADSGTRYHAIAVTGSLPVYDPRFERQLEVGGRLFVVVGEPPVMEARLVRRMSEGAWATASLFETVIDPLINAPRPPRFAF
ncbi:MAG TPA: protein-L-isoaspartate O-methyltransferase [Steroidobacteraceae bacterium]|nr:protein-L-isoaspartate O-methyltransferase [Steroidobacteraceae bacterium]